ncbi:uncharacterized protein A4U43_C07F13590 [Asparagus officinalis]|uniref:Uncharacterized protein n=1 Tax=Asparagus officinalis TaxID=4686 RepID=A0A5P1EBW2_ASPOF|nr:uncharacterized protein A4U43_C07F13590 [Asparagus officinalis]
MLRWKDLEMSIRFHRDCSRWSHLEATRELEHPKPEPPQELAAAPLDSMPLVILLLLLLAPLSADLQNSSFLHLNLHLFLLHPRKIGLEDVSLRRLFPVDAGVRKGRGLAESAAGTRTISERARRVERPALKGIPDIEGERVENVAPLTEDLRN